MSLIWVTTNVTEESIPDSFMTDFAKSIAEILSRPIEAVSVILRAGVSMFRYGNTDPAAIVEISDCQKFNEKEETREIIRRVTKFMLENVEIVEPMRITTILKSSEPLKIGHGNGVILSEQLEHI